MVLGVWTEMVSDFAYLGCSMGRPNKADSVFCHMIAHVEGYLVEKGRNINSKFFNGYRYVYHHGKDLSSFVFITSIQSRCFKENTWSFENRSLSHAVTNESWIGRRSPQRFPLPNSSRRGKSRFIRFFGPLFFTISPNKRKGMVPGLIFSLCMT